MISLALHKFDTRHTTTPAFTYLPPHFLFFNCRESWKLLQKLREAPPNGGERIGAIFLHLTKKSGLQKLLQNRCKNLKSFFHIFHDTRGSPKEEKRYNSLFFWFMSNVYLVKQIYLCLSRGDKTIHSKSIERMRVQRHSIHAVTKTLTEQIFSKRTNSIPCFEAEVQS